MAMADLDFRQLAASYRRELLENVIPFWERHSPDRVNGGYFTCLGRDGAVYDTDKFVWLQGRQVWMFSTLYNQAEARPDWLEMARLGADFLRRFGQAANGDWYFSLTREGKPLVQPYNIFSDCFAAMAFGQMSLASGEARDADLARSTYRRILERRDNPKGMYNKAVAHTRPMRNFALPMILCNLTLELGHLLDPAEVEATVEDCIHTVMDEFYDPHTGLIVENIASDGMLVDSFEGRLLNPGHAIEAMWFVMELARRKGDLRLIKRAVDIALRTIEYGWDKEYGGIFYFMDRLGKPPQQLEWDQKLWWVHVETLVALALGYELTGRKDCLGWFERVHAYTWAHFPDPDGGEWYGYLNRRGEVLLPLKGGKWKGCFHIPRGLLRCWRSFERISRSEVRRG